MSTPYFHDSSVTLHTGDAVEVLTELPEASVHCVVTNPPSWGLGHHSIARQTRGKPDCRHLSPAGIKSTRVLTAAAQRGRRCGAQPVARQRGLEATPQAYVDRLRDVFVALRRVLVDTGTVWLNLGDFYSAALGRSCGASNTDRRNPLRNSLLGVPWRVAFALQRDGWILRNAIVLHRLGATSDSVGDRLTNRYELLLLLTKQQKYYFNLDAIREPLARPEALDEKLVVGDKKSRPEGAGATTRRRGAAVYHTHTSASLIGHLGAATKAPGNQQHGDVQLVGKNPGDVWSISTSPQLEAHDAAYPIDIPLRCIAAGCPPDGVVLDPFSGAATTGLAAQQVKRDYIGIDLNPAFHDLGLRRLGLQRPADLTPQLPEPHRCPHDDVFEPLTPVA
jgi:site-specific DNA-methyltransferase (cytosine-N4-specific)